MTDPTYLCPKCSEPCEEYADHTDDAIPARKSHRGDHTAIQVSREVEGKGLVPKSKTFYMTHADLVCWPCATTFPRALCKRL